MTGQNRYRGFASMDALVSVIPILLMLLILWRASLQMADSSRQAMERQQTFNKLVSVADHTVKSGAVVREGEIRYPNWIDENLLTESYSEALRDEAGLDELYIGVGEPADGACIYRMVVVDDDKEIKQLFVCGV